MSGSNRGVIAVVGLGVAAGAAIAVYMLLVAGPADDARAVRAEIEQWETAKWQPLRTCLLGDDALAPDGRDALLLRWATSTEVLDETACLPVFHDLARPKTQASGSAAVEQAWRDLAAALGLLANRYAVLAPGDVEGMKPVADAFGEAERAHDALRSAAGMKPLPRPGAAIAAIGATTPLDGALRLARTAAVIDVRPENPAVAGTITRLSAGGTVHNAAAAHAVRALPSLSWGAWTERSAGGDLELYAGPLADDGTPGAGTLVGIVAGPDDDAELQLALDGGAERAIVLTLGGRYRPLVTVARSSDGGASWSVAAPVQVLTYAPNPAASRVDLVYADEAGTMIWLGLAASHLADARPVATSMGQVLSTCATADALWMIDSERLYVADAPGQIVGPVAPAPDNQLLACDDDLAVFRGFQRIATCTREGCDRNGAPAANVDGVAAAGVEGRPLVATTIDDLLLAWTGSSQRPAVYRMSEPMRVAAIAGWAQRTVVVLTGDGRSTFAVAELATPATPPAPSP